ncbi:T9SS type A sorting domain-containing protein, partial [candidate division KSB1 bacterium]|nr:T9SS type A sorting domain-containing protein [candidate division KSB1 bacterium]
MKNINKWIPRIAAVLFLTFNLLFAKDPEFSFIRIDLHNQSRENMHKLLKLNLDITYQNRTDQLIEAMVTKSQFQEIRKLGFTTKNIIDDMGEFEQQLRLQDYFSHFYSYEEMENEMRQIATVFPEIASLQSIGQSWEKREIWALKISDNVNQDETGEADVLYMANLHAREMITPDIIMYFMNWLIENYGTDAYITHLLNNRQLWLIPTLNPDGREHVFTGSIDNIWVYYDPIRWRKNLRDNNNNNMFDADSDGVDLNRNFGYEWGLDIGSSGNVRDNTYRGPEPFSEPETNSLRNFVEQHRFVISLSYHSYGQWLLFPWGHKKKNAETPDHAQFLALAENCVAYNGYTPANGAQFDYIVSGDSDDWLYGEQETKPKIFAFTPEVGSPEQNYFWPPPELIDDLVLENLGPNIYIAYAAGEEPIVSPEFPADTLYSAGPILLRTKIDPPIVLTQPANPDTSAIWLYYRTTDTTAYDSSQMVKEANNDYCGEIPPVGEGKSLSYYFSVTDELGRTGSSPIAAPMAVHSLFLDYDTTSPNITFEPLPDQPIDTDSIVFRAKITDSSAIDTAFVFYKINSSSTDSLALIPAGSKSSFEAVLPLDNLIPGDTLDYAFFAADISEAANQIRLPENGFYSLRIVSKTNLAFENDAQPESFYINQNYPNPFNAQTTIRYHIEHDSRIYLAVYNINGQRVAGLRNEWQQAGTHSLRWNSRDDAGNPVPSGIYIVRL